MSKEITLEQIRTLAEKTWEGCHHCDEYDKQFWNDSHRTALYKVT